MGLLWRTEKHYRGKKRKSYIRSCPLFSAGGIFLRDPDHAYDPDGQAKADPGSSRVCGRRDQQYAYVSYLYESGKGETLDVSGTNEREGSQLLEKVTAAYAVESVKRKISEQWVRDLSFYGTQITEDEMLQIIMKYKMPLPFSLFGQDSVDVETVCSRRLWTGQMEKEEKRRQKPGNRMKEWFI